MLLRPCRQLSVQLARMAQTSSVMNASRTTTQASPVTCSGKHVWRRPGGVGGGIANVRAFGGSDGRTAHSLSHCRQVENAEDQAVQLGVVLCPKTFKYGKKLFTPGPMGISRTVKEATLRDLGSRDPEFIGIVKHIRNTLVQLAGVSTDDYTCVPMQGSGTFSIEAVLSSTVPRDKAKVLILENGAYGKRQAAICAALGIPHHKESFSEAEPISGQHVLDVLGQHQGDFSHVAIVHCETSTGMFNPIQEVGQVIKQHMPDAVYFVDAMSSFGAVPLSMSECNIDYLVSSANKCLEGTPGFAYAICRKEHLLSCKGYARSVSLDLMAQYEGLENNGQFRFTPPTHSMLAFRQALIELEAEGGIEGRSKRYQANNSVLREGMAKMGFREFLKKEYCGYIVTSFMYPDHPAFNFNEFYTRLYEKDQVIYPGKLLDTDCFRLGNIGHLFVSDISYLLGCIADVCQDMNIKLPLEM